MKSLFDFAPLVIFFILYHAHDIYSATGALILATIVQVSITFIRHKRIERLQLITLLIVIIFGGLTLIVQGEPFVKWKATIVYGVLAIGLSLSEWLGNNIIKMILSDDLPLPDPVWRHLTWAWVAFFTGCAALNLYISFSMPPDVWVNFKIFGLLAATLLFILLTGVYAYPKRQQ